MSRRLGQGLQTPVGASWELELTGLAGRWPLVSLQHVEVGACAEFYFFISS